MFEVTTVLVKNASYIGSRKKIIPQQIPLET